MADRFDSLAGLFRDRARPDGLQGSLRPAARRARRGRDRDRAQLARGLAPGRAEGALALSGRAGRARADETLDELGRFFAERLRSLLERRGHCYDEISAVLNVGVWDFADAADRARALSEARRHMDFRSLILAFKRIRNILGDARAAARRRPSSTARTPSARSRPTSCRPAGDRRSSSGERHYREAMETIASIAPSLDRFFVDVLVNCPEEDLRRIGWPSSHRFSKNSRRLADFSEIVVERK